MESSAKKLKLALVMVALALPGPVGARSSASAAPADGPLAVDLAEFIQRVCADNGRISYQRLEFEIADESVKNARSILEYEFVGQYTHEEVDILNTAQDALQRSSLAQFHEFNERYNASVEGLLQSGGRISLGYTMDDLTNNLQRGLLTGLPFDEYRSFMGLQLNQPLLRDRGDGPTLARVRIAEADRDMAFQRYREVMIRILTEAMSAYWDLIGAQERVRLRSEAVEVAKELLEDNQARVAEGQMASTEIFEVEAGLSQRLSMKIAAEQDLREAMNNVRGFLALSVARSRIPIRGTATLDPPGGEDEPPGDFESSYAVARDHRPEILVAQRKARREGVRLAYSKNQRLPRLDLRASYGLNGLDNTPGDSFDEIFRGGRESWSVGLEFRVPLDGNTGAKSEYRAAKHRKKQALLEIESTERELANSLDSALAGVRATSDQRGHYRRAAEQNEKLFQVETDRFEQGFSTSRLLLERQATWIRALEDELASRIRHAKAMLRFEAVQGTLLARHELEPRP